MSNGNGKKIKLESAEVYREPRVSCPYCGCVHELFERVHDQQVQRCADCGRDFIKLD
jgi:uncharacterized Zn finger protein